MTDVITYARVSSLRQESEGQSLQNQERAFTQWLHRTGHVRVAAYRESASAKDVSGRVQFLRLIEELPNTKATVIVVDTLDRFTRNLKDGLELIEKLRGHHVGLLPLDWQRERPIDIDDDRDWQDVVEEFTSAERERRRIRRRVLRSYEGRRERGATTTTKAPVGLKKLGDVLVPSEHAWIIRELDERFLNGATQAELHAWFNSVSPRKWRNELSVRRALENTSYVTAGLRSPETQAQIIERRQLIAARYAKGARYPNPFAGVFYCGPCYDAGYRNLMSGQFRPGRANTFQLVCWEGRDKSAHPGKAFCVHSHRVVDSWNEMMADLRSNTEWWEQTEAPRRRGLERQLSQIDQQAASMKSRRDAAFNLLGDGDPGLVAQARKLLQEVEADETTLAAQRGMVLADLAGLQPARDANELRMAMEAYTAVYPNEPPEEQNRLNRALCAAIGSHPRVYRSKGGKWATVTVEWNDVVPSSYVSEASGL